MSPICWLIVVVMITIQGIECNSEDKPVFRVVKGHPANLGDVPFQVSIGLNNAPKWYTSVCGGSIIKKDTVLSAAHCFALHRSKSRCKAGWIPQSQLRGYAVIAGNLLVDVHFDHCIGQILKLKSVQYPKLYRLVNNDICIVKTDGNFVFNAFVRPIPFARKFMDYSGLTCQVSGYGLTKFETGSRPRSLLKAFIEVLPLDICVIRHRKSTRRFICTDSNLSDIAQGDSGGPLACWNTGDPAEDAIGLLVGITSGRDVEAYRSTVDVLLGIVGLSKKAKGGTFFTRVSIYSSFIDSKVDQPKVSGLLLLQSIVVIFIK